MASRTTPVWRPTERRWRLRCAGHDHYFSPAQRGLEPTKEASRSAATHWAANVRADADEARRKSSLGLDQWEWHQMMCRHAMEVARARSDPRAYRYFKRGADHAAQQIRIGAKYPRVSISAIGEPPGIPLDEPWRSEVISPQEIVDPAAEFFAELLGEVQHGELTAQHYETIRLRVGDREACLSKRPRAIEAYRRSFEGFLEAHDGSVRSLDAELWREWSRHLRSLDKWSSATKAGAWRVSRAYVRWAVGKGLVASLPSTFHNRKLSLSDSGREEVPVLSPEQLAAVFAACDTNCTEIPKAAKRARTQLRDDEIRARKRVYLFALLALNTSCTSRDIADLRQSEISFEKGVLRRRRSKTRRTATVPTTRYRLWPETIQLLKEFASTDVDLLLLHDDGKPLWQPPIPGVHHKRDRIGDAWDYLRRRVRNKLKVELPPFGVLKKTSATLLERRCGRKVAGLFLGHTARSIQARHYVRADFQSLSRGLHWLRSVYFDSSRRSRVLGRLTQ